MKFSTLLVEKYIPIVIKTTIVFLLGGFTIHLIAMLIDYYFMPTHFIIESERSYLSEIFSPSMLPMLIVYGVGVATVYIFWEKLNAAYKLARTKQIQSQNTLLAIQSLQRMAGILAEHITSHNNEVRHWIESQRTKGRQPPPKIDSASQKISDALLTLSEIAFLYPYTSNSLRSIADLEDNLRCKLENADLGKNEIEKLCR